MNAKNEILQVHIFARKAEQLAYPHPGIEGDESDDVRPSFVTLDGLPVYKPVHLLRAKRR